MTLFLSPAYARKKADSVPLTASVQEAQAATLEDDGISDTEKPKKKSKAKKAKKSKKAKKQ